MLIPATKVLSPRLIAAAALVLPLFLAPAAHAGDKGGPAIGYGMVYQKRLDVESKGHLIAIGFKMQDNNVFLLTDLEIVIDDEFHDVTQYGLSTTAGAALGGETAGVYLGGGVRSSIDGYPRPSWSPIDLGLALGLYLNLGPVGIGADGRYWLGFNMYGQGDKGEEATSKIEPYVDWRIWLSFGL